MTDRRTLRKDLLAAFAVLFGGAVLVAAAGLAAVLPILNSPGDAILFILALLVGDLAVLFLFGRIILREALFDPLDGLVGDVRRIAEGAHAHRVSAADSEELHALSESVNAMAERLLRDQAELAQNIESLEETNQELVVARQQMVRAARLATVGTLAAGLAHEIGNPLGAILGYLDVARRRNRDDPELSDVLDSTFQEARRIDRIIRSLLDFARPKAEFQSTADPERVIDQVVSLLEAQGRLDALELVWSPPPGPIPPIRGDSQPLEQILVNLLLNAGDALEGRSDARVTVLLETRKGKGADLPLRREDDPPGINYLHRRRVSPETPTGLADPLETAEEIVVITVADNGPGLSDEVLDQIFDPFFTTKEPGKGTGLGMAVCARLVEDLDGRIEAGNSEDGGAVFTLVFPAVRAGEEIPASAGAAETGAPLQEDGAGAGP